ncbi:DMT family transporter [Syntrophomonas palmitatica]|uniref:DMT family transporter n=1 Tax=Syntrophomonas palmitatica TaxID=402877 RepID=UPI00155DBB2D|nr:DMT family transporter [Syntrophomonas palmitatica]
MKWKAIGALALTTILFSTFEVVSRLIAFDIEPLQVNFLRFIIGGLALLPLAIMDMRKQSIRLDGDDFKNLLWLGLLNVTFCLSIFQISIKYIPASAAAVIFCTNRFLFIYLNPGGEGIISAVCRYRV